MIDQVEVEKCLIGEVLYHPDSMVQVSQIVDVEDFIDTKNKITYQAILEMHQNNDHIGMYSVLEKCSLLTEDEFSVAYLIEVDCKGPHVNMNPIGTAEVLRHLAVKRKQKELGIKFAKNAQSEKTKSQNDISEMLIKVEELNSRLTPIIDQTFEECAHETINAIIDNEGEELGVKTGNEHFDNATQGLCSPDLTVLAAGTGEGKSTMMLNWAKNVAIHHGRVLIFSLEMKRPQMIWKLLSDELDTSVANIRIGNLDKDKLLNASTPTLNIEIIDNGSITIDQLESIVKTEHEKDPLKAVFIDYLQLIGIGAYGKNSQNRTNEVSIISRKIKALAMDTNLPFIALSQLKRKEGRKTYVKSDLRESGSIEQDADNIYFIYRPHEHGQDSYNLDGFDTVVNKNEAIGILAKCRLGQISESKLGFNGEYSRFENLEPDSLFEWPNNQTPNQDIKPNKNLSF